MDSILNTIKKLMGITEEYTHFDQDLIIHINSVLMILNQIGVGKEGFIVRDESDAWGDFIEDEEKIEGVKTYVFIRTKLVFDPPSSSIVSDSYKKMADELEFRLNLSVDPPKEGGEQ